MTQSIRKAVFPVAGLGTRFLPATKAIPKEMLPVVDKPLIQYTVEEAWASGIEQVIFVTGRGKGAIEDHFDHAVELEAVLGARNKVEETETVRQVIKEPGEIIYVRQQQALGLGHAVWCARHLTGDEPFAVILPDDLVLSKTPCLAQLIAVHDQVGGNVVAVEDVPREQTNRYGILDVVDDDGTLARAQGLVEKPDPEVAPSTLSIIGRYVLQPDVMAALGAQETGAGGEIQLTDAMAKTIQSQPFHGLRFEGERYDCGSKDGFLAAQFAFSLQRADLRDKAAGLIRRFADELG